MPLGDVVDTIQGFVGILFLVYLLCIFAYILTSWIPMPYNVWLNRVQRFLYDVVDPYLRLFRRFIPQLNMGGLGLDLSPIFAILVLYALNRIVQGLLDYLH
jgi:YggT family protein